MVKTKNQENLFRFESDLKKFAEQIDVDVGKVVRRVALDLYAKITMRTPVDTGRARASWGIDVGRPSNYVAGERLGGSENITQMAKLRAVTDKRLGETTIWLFNNLPYIVPLEYGHSGQAPNGMVRISVAEVEAELESMLR